MKQAAAFSLLLSFGLITAGCAEHRYGVRVYDPYYSDYHQWSPDEDGYYHTWYTTTYSGRPYREYRRIDRDDQRAYWNWRHQHGGDRDHHDRDDRDHRDHDRDRDRDHDRH